MGAELPWAAITTRGWHGLLAYVLFEVFVQPKGCFLIWPFVDHQKQSYDRARSSFLGESRKHFYTFRFKSEGGEFLCRLYVFALVGDKDCGLEGTSMVLGILYSLLCLI